MINELFLTARILFVQEGCPHCLMYKMFIEQVNSNLPFGKQIELIDCSPFEKYGIISDPRILIFDKDIQGYPTLFINGHKKDGLIWFIKAYLDKEFILRESNDYLFDRTCNFKNGRKKLICS